MQLACRGQRLYALLDGLVDLEAMPTTHANRMMAAWTKPSLEPLHGETPRPARRARPLQLTPRAALPYGQPMAMTVISGALPARIIRPVP